MQVKPVRCYFSFIILLYLPKTHRTISLHAYDISSKEELFDEFYPKSNIARVKVPKTHADWTLPCPNYNPKYILHKSVVGQPWADSENVTQYRHKFNTLDGDLDRRRSRRYTFAIELKTGRPLNPNGRTGICGRGLLGRWGPNHSSLLIVTRWFHNYDGTKQIMPSTGKALMEFVAVKFNGQYFLPGGFVEPNESYMKRAQEEFLEEALNASSMPEKERASIAKHLEELYNDKAHFLYQGYIKDNRNTDNAWIEGCVSNLHDETRNELIAYHLKPGDGAEDAKWLMVHRDMNINPWHKEFMKVVADVHNAHW